MATTTETPVRAYAHCRNSRCSGNAQVEIDAVLCEYAQTFGDNGGDGAFFGMVERSTIEYAFADPEQAPCVSCKQPREVTGQQRPTYQNLSGHDPKGLLYVEGYDASQEAPASAGFGESDDEIELRLRAKIREEQIEAKLRAEMAG